ncbi:MULTISPECIES: hypothetical protein [unclassified Rhizobium]|uniref:hypothetical protein n=1 Tax=unclassified Rhizobium TaxID=2613769 RepID=UPI0015D15F35|nr:MULTISPECIES: hypothetical protein [unclassified Rhizobium]MBA1348793.1 hypothetical protein [Rhizobium sp. WYCCWR 11146]NYT30382.1 hypothetical protein [Rhizobium sp. WYCCWR 11128]
MTDRRIVVAAAYDPSSRRCAADAQNFARPAKTKLSPVFRPYFSYCRTHQYQGKA